MVYAAAARSIPMTILWTIPMTIPIPMIDVGYIPHMCTIRRGRQRAALTTLRSLWLMVGWSWKKRENVLTKGADPTLLRVQIPCGMRQAGMTGAEKPVLG